jgi:hypothetical protein
MRFKPTVAAHNIEHAGEFHLVLFAQVPSEEIEIDVRLYGRLEAQRMDFTLDHGSAPHGWSLRMRFVAG